MQFLPTQVIRTVLTTVVVCIGMCASAAELVVPGAGPPEAVLKALAAAFNAAQRTHQVLVPTSSGVAGALREIRTDTAVLARMPRPLEEAELPAGLRCLAFARDSVVFFTGAGVKVRSVTQSQLQDIFSGRITDWRELGDEAAPIRVVVRQPDESLLRVIRQAFPTFGQNGFGPDAKMVRLDPHMVDMLDRFDRAIGWGASTSTALAKTPIRPLQLDGVAPTAANLASGKYPLSTDACLLFKGTLRDAAAQSFIDFVFSPAGRGVIEGLGMVPLARK